MISGWDIYWVMQLDSIRTGFTVIAAGSVCSLLLLMFVDCVYDDEEEAKGIVRRWVASVIAVSGVSLCAGMLLPSSKTAAAILIIPAVANNEAIQKEAGDLYQLAKDGLRQLVEPEEKPEK